MERLARVSLNGCSIAEGAGFAPMRWGWIGWNLRWEESGVLCIVNLKAYKNGMEWNGMVWNIGMRSSSELRMQESLFAVWAFGSCLINILIRNYSMRYDKARYIFFIFLMEKAYPL